MNGTKLADARLDDLRRALSLEVQTARDEFAYDDAAVLQEAARLVNAAAFRARYGEWPLSFVPPAAD